MAIRLYSDPVGVLSIGRNPIQVLSIRSDPILSDPVLVLLIPRSLELMQVFANGKRHFHSFIEFFVIHLKTQGVKI